MTPRIVILGGGYAGTLAALRAARAQVADVTLVDAKDALVDRIRLHEVAAGARAVATPYAELLDGTGVTFVQGRVARIGDEVELDDGRHLAYDKLIVTLGSDSGRTGMPGLEHAIAPGNPEGAERLAAALPHARKVAVIGGGFTGIEVSTEIAEVHPHLAVVLIDAGRIGPHFSAGGRAALFQSFDALRITARENEPVQRLEAGAVITEKGRYDVDVIVWCGSFRASPLVAELGEVDGLGRVRVDASLRAPGRPNVRVAGDCAAVTLRGYDLRMACATAMPMGAYAADATVAELRGQEPPPFRFAFFTHCLSIGRKRGLTQFTNANDEAHTAITGWAGAQIKDLIVKYPLRALWLERRGVPYRWPKGPKPVEATA